MPKTISYAAFVAALALAGPCLAQSPSSAGAGQPPTKEAAPQTAAPASTAPPTASTGASADTAANAGASATVMSGMSVKDNTGALIGEVKSVNGGVATIAMGADTFTVDTNKLGMANGAATINASQAELKKMLPPKK